VDLTALSKLTLPFYFLIEKILKISLQDEINISTKTLKGQYYRIVYLVDHWSKKSIDLASNQNWTKII
jgi:hypothetical protein